MTDNTALARRIGRIEDRAAIQDLGVMYGYIMDERDIDGIRRIFCEDATLRSADGVFAAEGIDKIVETYQGRFAALGPTNHFTHGHVVTFDDADPDVARGLLASHAEVVRDGKPMVVALRYQDTYRRTSTGWRFADRLMSYMYYTEVTEYANVLGKALRVRAYGDERPADWPEVLDSGQPPAWIKDYLG
ncbi:nuclear transport factor 2 family protein [Prauserella oleivorans]|uniref:Nuclear transport factor 2 family protein n=1 Tax=Prauserella oleivorans TaxID=1478153 RepID=A0ABW5WGM9_9PSEU